MPPLHSGEVHRTRAAVLAVRPLPTVPDFGAAVLKRPHRSAVMLSGLLSNESAPGCIPCIESCRAFSFLS